MDISRMYRAVLLPEAQCDLHRFVWRRHQHGELKNYRMTKLKFGVLASSFTTNMAVRMNAIQNGRTQQAMEPYNRRHPFIILSKHRFTKMLTEFRHACLLHTGPTLIAASLSQRFAIVGARQAVRDVTWRCIICYRVAE